MNTTASGAERAAATLTERYIHAAARSVPQDKRAELRRELAVTIGELVEARTGAGETEASAERAVLTELGDPAAFAAAYTDGPTHLIGPGYYQPFRMLMRTLLLIVVPIVAIAVLIGQLIHGSEPLHIAGTIAVTTLHLVLHLFFWTALVFVCVERYGTEKDRRSMIDFDPENLPEVATGRISRAETWVEIGLLVLLGFMLVFQQFNPFLRDGTGQSMPILNPELWSLWIPAFLGLIAANIVLLVAVSTQQRYSYLFAALTSFFSVAITALILWLYVTGQLFNPTFLELIDLPDDAIRAVSVLLVVLMIVWTVWECFDAFRKARRSRSA